MNGDEFKESFILYRKTRFMLSENDNKIKECENDKDESIIYSLDPEPIDYSNQGIQSISGTLIRINIS